MAGRWLSAVRTLLVFANFLGFVAVFSWASVVQGRADWWLKLNWTTWLTDLQSAVYLREVAVGSFWIVWALVSLLITLLWLADKLQRPIPDEARAVVEVSPAAEDVESPVLNEEIVIQPELAQPEVVDEVRLKILKLQESLKQI